MSKQPTLGTRIQKAQIFITINTVVVFLIMGNYVKTNKTKPNYTLKCNTNTKVKP